MYDIWNEQFDLVDEVYSQKNYCITEYPDRTSNTCYIYFSSNNIWFPNEEKAFRKSFVDHNYFEWEKYTDVPAKKIIWMRDIFKSWYVTGINCELDCIDKVIDFLIKETEGMEVVTVGSSAGGYMAVLTAALLNAERCICFSAQFSLVTKDALEANPFLQRYEEDGSRNRYYRIKDIIRLSKTQIFYIMPAYAAEDIVQLKYVKDLENVHVLMMASCRHGIPVLKGNLTYLLKMDSNELTDFFSVYDQKKMSKEKVSIALCGLFATLSCIKNEWIRIVKILIERGLARIG